MLRDGLSESGYLEKDQFRHFYFTDRALMDPAVTIKYGLHVLRGAVTLKSKVCSFSGDLALLEQECTFTLEEMKRIEPDEIFGVSEASD
mmetsp:Transcript_18505/g.31678  ORF Transcript_18505/g.31678 Transcript_18505/m.31678 type:complete len:89 (+) Transcript_18505:1226-1492(+)